jgi:ParB family chromosome partitioning protein
VSRSFADLRTRAVMDLDPALIDAGGVQDRLERDVAEDASLARSIEEHGQQVPVLVRPHPEAEGRYQIVYGRRRVLALRTLGRPVKALVRDLDDRELLLAQGQENTARRDLSFIEKANFARQMTAAGYDRKAVCDALSVDKTLISRMLSVTERVPIEVIEYVGAAPSVGRERWSAVADKIARGRHEPARLIAMIDGTGATQTSDSRFGALQSCLEQPTRPAFLPAPVPARPLHGAGGARLGSARVTGDTLVLRLDRIQAQGFEDWLLDQLPEIHRDWLARRGG